MSLTAPYKILVVLAILLLDFAGYYLMDYRPKLAELGDLRLQLERSRGKLDARREAAAELDETERELAGLEMELARLVTQTNADPVGTYVQHLEDAVSRTPLVLESVTANDQASAPPGIAALGFQANIHGDFDSLGDLLHQLGETNAESRVTIDRVLVTAGTGPGKLDIALPMTAYLGERTP